jgi:hypothetical protein
VRLSTRATLPIVALHTGGDDARSSAPSFSCHTGKGRYPLQKWVPACAGTTAYGDLGSFGVAAHVDWQVVGTLDYALKPWVALGLGYRSLNVTASGSDFSYNLHMKGPILAARFQVEGGGGAPFTGDRYRRLPIGLRCAIRG